MEETDRWHEEVERLFLTDRERLGNSLVEGDLIPVLKQRGIEVKSTARRMKGRLDGRPYEIEIMAGSLALPHPITSSPQRRSRKRSHGRIQIPSSVRLTASSLQTTMAVRAPCSSTNARRPLRSARRTRLAPFTSIVTSPSRPRTKSHSRPDLVRQNRMGKSRSR